MDRKLLALQVDLHELHDEVERNSGHNENTLADLLWAIRRLEQDVGRNFSVLQDRSLVILDQQTACANHDRLREKLLGCNPKRNQTSYKPLEQILFSFESHNPDCITTSSTAFQLDSTTSATITEPTTPATAPITVTEPKTSTTPPTTTTTTTTTITSTTTVSPSYESCKNVLTNVSGVYIIRVSNSSDPFKAYCEQEKFGGGWIVVQHRFNGSIDFYRNWDEYRDGFGNLDSEFWLGLEKMHQITRLRAYELIVALKDFSGNYAYARYNAFEIGSEDEQYRLKTLGSYSGTAGDSMTATNKRMKFSTKDRENDVTVSGCARSFQGGWWYNGCTYANLNGLYMNVVNYRSMHWYSFKNDYHGLSFSRMMIREI
ncbi:angiopoietin-related protein 1-like [Anopheles darlingi]|uniref:angiopoietin-related protein 1-like n=1 Tax=Anopheles darlingi TaxID=43151 RepID=UPI0021002D20|nr:angiopoietin-related protein 1-like [Anopheles darlingi]